MRKLPYLPQSRTWWLADEGKAHERVLPYVRTVENFQVDLYDKFRKLESTYDVNPRTNRFNAQLDLETRSNRVRSVVTENLIASNVDTVAAEVADTDVRVRIETDGADWQHQQTAKRLERYSDGLSKLFGVGDKCRIAFKSGAALKGTGPIKVWTDRFDQIRVANVPIDNIIVDELECRDGEPKQLHYRDFFDRDDLCAQFPEHAEAIARAQGSGDWRTWAGYRPMQGHEVVVIESWRLPIGPKGHKNYVAGRHTLVIDGCDLLDEPYDKPHYPFAFMRWNRPTWGFYGISLAERILPHQRLLNRRNYQINKSLDRKADPVTYVHQGDSNLAVKTVNQIGAIAVYKIAKPETVDHQAVGQETYNSRLQIKEDAFQESGVSRMAAQAIKPSGIDSAVGLREYRDQRSQRFSIQEKEFEALWLAVNWLILDACRDLGGTKAPDIVRVSKFGHERIKWSEVDMDDLKIEMMGASTIADTPAGRQQRLVELAQAGVITLDESRALMEHPDISRILSLYNAMIEDIENTIYQIERGNAVVPEPYQNLQVGVAMLQKEYLLIRHVPDVPEEVLEGLTSWISIAANILNPPPPPMMPGMMPAGPGGPGLPPGTPAPGQPGPGAFPTGPAAQLAAAAPTFAPGTYGPMAG
jgi:hypothetical protein